MTAREVTAFLHTRNCATFVTALTILATLAAYYTGNVVEIPGDMGMMFPSANLWIAGRTTSLWVNVSLTVILAAGCVWINKAFNIMRSMTGAWTTFFAVILSSLPTVAGQFYGGTLLCVVITAITVLMITCFGDRRRTRRIFLMFFLLSVTALFQYAVIFYLVVLFLGLAQMRVLNLRSTIAALLGIITPAWILFGCGIVDPDEVRMPEFVGTLSVLDKSEMVVTFVAIGLTSLLGVMAMVGNLMKVISYTAKFRSANGFMAITLLCTIIFIFIDYNNLLIYVPLLDLLTAYQLGHFMSNHRYPRSYILMLSVIALYIAIYVAGYFL